MTSRKKPADVAEIIVNTDALAKMLGFTRQRINQLAQEGLLEKQAPGRWPLMKNIQRYIEFLRTGVKDRNDDEEAQAMYWEEKALHEKAKRETAEIKLAKLRGQMHDATDKRLSALTGVADAIKEVYNALPPEKQKLVRLRYWTRPRLLTWDGIALELHVSRRQAMRWRDEIVLAVALKLGWR